METKPEKSPTLFFPPTLVDPVCIFSGLLLHWRGWSPVINFPVKFSLWNRIFRRGKFLKNAFLATGRFITTRVYLYILAVQRIARSPWDQLRTDKQSKQWKNGEWSDSSCHRPLEPAPEEKPRLLLWTWSRAKRELGRCLLKTLVPRAVPKINLLVGGRLHGLKILWSGLGLTLQWPGTHFAPLIFGKKRNFPQFPIIFPQTGKMEKSLSQ